jgi:hypothetical protein
MKFCPVVPEICSGQVHPFSKWLPKHCIKMGDKNSTLSTISSKFDMWVDNDVPN